MDFSRWAVGEHGGQAAVVACRPLGGVVCVLHSERMGAALARSVAEELVSLQDARMAGTGVYEAYPPVSWYADAAWTAEQVLRRSWVAACDFTGRGGVTAVEVDGQFGEHVLRCGTPASAAYVAALHNDALLPVR